MNTKTHIRLATQDDVESLTLLRELMLLELNEGAIEPERLSELRELSNDWLRVALSDGRAAGWIAEMDGEMVGGASITIISTQPQFRSPEVRVASIYGVYVKPEHRGQGIATAVVKTAVDYAREIGIVLATLHAAEKARAIYERIGFEPSTEMRLFL